jgi:hypothetical protein
MNETGVQMETGLRERGISPLAQEAVLCAMPAVRWPSEAACESLPYEESGAEKILDQKVRTLERQSECKSLPDRILYQFDSLTATIG